MTIREMVLSSLEWYHHNVAQGRVMMSEEILDWVKIRFPDVVGKLSKASLSSTLSKMVERGELMRLDRWFGKRIGYVMPLERFRRKKSDPIVPRTFFLNERQELPAESRSCCTNGCKNWDCPNL